MGRSCLADDKASDLLWASPNAVLHHRKSCQRQSKCKMEKTTYPKMIVDAILSNPSKTLTKKAIGAYIQNNYKSIATGARFDNALTNNLQKASKTNVLKYDEDTNTYKIGSKSLSKNGSKKQTKKALPFRKYKYAISRTKCCDKEEHVWTPEHFKSGMKLVKEEIAKIKRNIAQQKEKRTPKLQRKAIYAVLASHMIKNGYFWYGPGHALPGIFRELLNKEMPDKTQ
eukprot:792223_1